MCVYTLLTQSSFGMKNAWDLSQNTIICMAQTTEAVAVPPSPRHIYVLWTLEGMYCVVTCYRYV